MKSIPEKQKVKLKGGAAVDPDSGIEGIAHVYKVSISLCIHPLSLNQLCIRLEVREGCLLNFISSGVKYTVQRVGRD